MKRQPAHVQERHDVDRRLIALIERAFQVAKRHRRDALLDHITLVMGCTNRDAIAHLLDLEEARYVLVRGAGPAGLVYSTELMDTEALRPRRLV